MEIIVLEPMVLCLTRNYRNDVLALPREEDVDENRAMRHAAYRQFILWQCGYLRKGYRRVVPSCCMWRTYFLLHLWCSLNIIHWLYLYVFNIVVYSMAFSSTYTSVWKYARVSRLGFTLFINVI